MGSGSCTLGFLGHIEGIHLIRSDTPPFSKTSGPFLQLASRVMTLLGYLFLDCCAKTVVAHIGSDTAALRWRRTRTCASCT